MAQSKFLQIVAATSMAIALGACTSPETQRSAAQYNDDASINTNVQAAVVSTPGVHANDIQVTTYRGVVDLKGIADNQQAAVDAVEAARNVSGVKEVNYDIKVRQK
ncbi:MAG TPA: BON domain-containing protein [Eoetvoesiella sp.]